MNRAAAFFDLDRTLMAGSSGMHFARAAYRGGLVTRPQLAKLGFEHVRFRRQGSTDERTAQVLSQVKELLAGVPERDIERMAPGLLAGVLPRIYPACSTRCARTRTPAGQRSSSAPPGTA